MLSTIIRKVVPTHSLPLWRGFSTLNARKFPYRFEYNESEAWTNYLDEHGFVVVNALEANEAKQAADAMLDTLVYLSNGKLDKNLKETFAKAENYPYMWKEGMIQYIAHTKWQWELREKTAHVFAKLWSEPPHNMATSFDGFCYMNEQRVYEKTDPISWLHVDQSPSKNFKWCVQGVLNLLPSYENDGGLIVIPKSHLDHSQFFKDVGKQDLTFNFYTFSQQEKQDKRFENHLKVCAEPGDLMLFDSRTFHCNIPPSPGHSRACAYICQMPYKTVTEEIRKQRKIAFQDHRVSTHHPGDDFEVFPYIPYEADPGLVTKIKDLSLQFEHLTPMQKSLCCFSDFAEQYKYKKIGESILQDEAQMVLIRMRPF